MKSSCCGMYTTWEAATRTPSSLASIGVEEMLKRQYNVLAHNPVSLRRRKDSRFVLIA